MNVVASLLALVPHRHEPLRVYTPAGWAYKCRGWSWCPRHAATEPEFYGGGNSDGWVDMRGRNW